PVSYKIFADRCSLHAAFRLALLCPPDRSLEMTQTMPTITTSMIRNRLGQKEPSPTYPKRPIRRFDLIRPAPLRSRNKSERATRRLYRNGAGRFIRIVYIFIEVDVRFRPDA